MKVRSTEYVSQDNAAGGCPNRRKLNTAADSGFSLIELVLTVAIVAVALVPMIGILSMVSQNGHQSDSIFLSSSIASQIKSEVDQSNRAQIESWASRSNLEYYYDFEGLAVASDEEAAFTARLIIEKSPVKLGGDVENTYLGKATVHVCSIPGPKGAQLIDEMLSSDTNRQPRNIRTYSSVIVDLEK